MSLVIGYVILYVAACIAGLVGGLYIVSLGDEKHPADEAQESLDSESRLYLEKGFVVNDYAYEHFESAYSFDPEKDLLRVYDGNHYDGDAKVYKVFFKHHGGVEIFTLHPLPDGGPTRDLSEKKNHNAYRVHNRSTLLNCCSKKRFNKEREEMYFSGIFQRSTELLLKLGQKAAEEGSVSVYGADFNEQELPSKKQLRIIANELEKAGFRATKINYKTGLMDLVLQ